MREHEMQSERACNAFRTSLGVSKYCLQLTTMSKGLETFVAFDWGLGDTASLYTLNAGLNALSCPHT